MVNLILGFCIGIASVIYSMANFPVIDDKIQGFVDVLRPSMIETVVNSIKEN